MFCIFQVCSSYCGDRDVTFRRPVTVLPGLIQGTQLITQMSGMERHASLSCLTAYCLPHSQWLNNDVFNGIFSAVQNVGPCLLWVVKVWTSEWPNDQWTPIFPKTPYGKEIAKKKKQQNQSNKKSFFYTWYMLGIFFCGKYNTLDLPVGTGF